MYHMKQLAKITSLATSIILGGCYTSDSTIDSMSKVTDSQHNCNVEWDARDPKSFNIEVRDINGNTKKSSVHLNGISSKRAQELTYENKCSAIGDIANPKNTALWNEKS